MMASIWPAGVCLLLRNYPFRCGLMWLAVRTGADRTTPPRSGWVRAKEGFALKVPADRMYSLLYFTGRYEPDESALLKQTLRPGDVFLDVGGNIGWYACLAGKLVGPQGRVLSFEPLEEAAESLVAAVRRNGMSEWVKVVKVALADADGSVRINTFSGLPIGHASASTLGRSDAIEHVCRQTRLDDVLASESIRSAEVMKCDVEGYEPLVFAGAKKLLSAEDAPIVLFEANRETLGACGSSPERLFDQLRAFGYSQFFGIGKSGRLVRREAPDTKENSRNYVAVKEGRLPQVASCM